MIKLSRTVSYALQATLQLAQAEPKVPVPCSKIASDGAMPERFLLQILRSLVTHGILESTRGVDGGYSLIRKPDEVSMLEVIEAIDGPIASHAVSAEGLTDTSKEKLKLVLDQVTLVTRDALAAIKLSEIIDSPVVPMISG